MRGHDYRSICAHVACIHCLTEKHVNMCEEHIRMSMWCVHSLFALLEQRRQDDSAFQDQGIVEI